VFPSTYIAYLIFRYGRLPLKVGETRFVATFTHSEFTSPHSLREFTSPHSLTMNLLHHIHSQWIYFTTFTHSEFTSPHSLTMNLLHHIHSQWIYFTTFTRSEFTLHSLTVNLLHIHSRWIYFTFTHSEFTSPHSLTMNLLHQIHAQWIYFTTFTQWIYFTTFTHNEFTSPNVKVKLSLCLINHHAMKTLGNWRCNSIHSQSRHEKEWASHPCRFLLW